MAKPLDLILLEDWKQRTRVFVTRRKPQAITPMMPKEAYAAEREGMVVRVPRRLQPRRHVGPF